jgi:hypothetical protein
VEVVLPGSVDCSDRHIFRHGVLFQTQKVVVGKSENLLNSDLAGLDDQAELR